MSYKALPRKNSEESFKKLLAEKEAKLPEVLSDGLKLESKNIDANFRTFIKQLCRNSSALPLNLIFDTNNDVENHFGDFSLSGGLSNKVADAFRSILLSTDSGLIVLAANITDRILHQALKNRNLLDFIGAQRFKLDGYNSSRFFSSAAEVFIEVSVSSWIEAPLGVHP